MRSNLPTLAKRVVTAAGMAATAAGLVILSGALSSTALASPPDPDPEPTTCTEAAAAGLLPIPPNDSRVTLCHFTGSDGNPFVINQPSLSAALTHAGHHDDCVRYFDGSVQCGL